MYIALGLDLERHLNQQYATVNYIQHVLVPDIIEKRKPKAILEFYSFRIINFSIYNNIIVGHTIFCDINWNFF